MKKNILIILSITIFSCFAYFGVNWMIKRNNFIKAAEAVSGFPYQIGLAPVTQIIQCQVSCCVVRCSCCVGGTLCSTILSEIQCITHSEVQGVPAGGMGDRALVSDDAILGSGIVAGAQMLAGGMTMLSMDSGVFGGPKGVFFGK